MLAPDWLAVASLFVSCLFELGGLSEDVGLLDPSVEVVLPGGPVALADVPVVPGLPDVWSVTWVLLLPPPPGSALAPPPGSLGEASAPDEVELDGPTCWFAGVPAFACELEVVPSVGAAWLVSAAVVVPVGWVSAKAAGAETTRAMVTADIATPPTPARAVHVSDELLTAPPTRVRSSRSLGNDHDSVALSLSRISTAAEVRSSRFRAFDHDSATRGVEATTVMLRARSSPVTALDHVLATP